jgi:hypothetical protein
MRSNVTNSSSLAFYIQIISSTAGKLQPTSVEMIFVGSISLHQCKMRNSCGGTWMHWLYQLTNNLDFYFQRRFLTLQPTRNKIWPCRQYVGPNFCYILRNILAYLCFHISNIILWVLWLVSCTECIVDWHRHFHRNYIKWKARYTTLEIETTDFALHFPFSFRARNMWAYPLSLWPWFYHDIEIHILASKGCRPPLWPAMNIYWIVFIADNLTY